MHYFVENHALLKLFKTIIECLNVDVLFQS